MLPIRLVVALVSLCTWLSRLAEASGPGEPFPVGLVCWLLVLLLALLVIVLLGLLIREKRKNQQQ